MCSAPLQVRLADSERENSGRVEIRHKGVWGTICDDHFGEKEAGVICKMLGFGNVKGQIYNGTNDFRGSGPVWIRLTHDDVCTGNEATIQECKVMKYRLKSYRR